jgi:retron-type reverse transcriptase
VHPRRHVQARTTRAVGLGAATTDHESSIICRVYSELERSQIADALARAFLDGGRWRADDLAERGAGVLEPRPEWIEQLSFATVALTRSTPTVHERRRVEEFIESWLADRPEATGRDARAPLVIALLEPDLTRRGGVRSPVIARGWPIAEVERVVDLADRLELDLGQLAWLADVRSLERRASDERLRNYRYRWIPRRSGLPRLIEAPKLRLKEVQRWILREILSGVPAHDAAHGFTRGRSAITHATVHCGQPAVLALDLRDFFPSVAASRVYGIFCTLGYQRQVAHLLTGLCTNVAPLIAWNALPPGGERDGSRFRLGRALAAPHLPQGAPTSPALANLAAFGLDRRLAGLAARFGLRYSRYADDLTFSGAALTGRRSTAVAGYAARIAREEGFALQPRKSRLRTAARRQVVTGVVVNAHPNLARAEYDRLRATLHRLALDGPPAASGGVDVRAQLRGRVAWAESLNPGRGAKLRRLYDRIDWDREHGDAGGSAGVT